MLVKDIVGVLNASTIEVYEDFNSCDEFELDLYGEYRYRNKFDGRHGDLLELDYGGYMVECIYTYEDRLCIDVGKI